MIKRPTFIIAGEAKAGTSALYSYLTQHPNVFMCKPKEPRYFAFPEKRPDFCGPMDETWVNNTTIYKKNAYYQLFDDAKEGSAVGDASPIYMHIPGCAKEIASELPEVKVIILLRNPVQLAFSAYQHMVRNGYEDLSFEDALKEENKRISKNWAWHWRYAALGVVSKNIEEYLKYFPRKNILFLNYDDFQLDNMIVLKNVCDFLTIDSNFKFKPTRANVNARHRLLWLRNMLTGSDNKLKIFFRYMLPRAVRHRMIVLAMKLNSFPVKETIKDEIYNELLKYYDDDIKQTENLTGLDLQKWYLN